MPPAGDSSPDSPVPPAREAGSGAPSQKGGGLRRLPIATPSMSPNGSRSTARRAWGSHLLSGRGASARNVRVFRVRSSRSSCGLIARRSRRSTERSPDAVPDRADSGLSAVPRQEARMLLRTAALTTATRGSSSGPPRCWPCAVCTRRSTPPVPPCSPCEIHRCPRNRPRAARGVRGAERLRAADLRRVPVRPLRPAQRGGPPVGEDRDRRPCRNDRVGNHLGLPAQPHARDGLGLRHQRAGPRAASADLLRPGARQRASGDCRRQAATRRRT